MELSECPCVPHSFVPAQGTSSRGLLRASSTGAASIFWRGRLHWEVQDSRVYMMTGGTTGAACPRWGEGGSHILCWSLGPASCEGTSVLFSQVLRASVEANFTSLPAKPDVMLARYHKGRALLLGLNWELNAMLGAATRRTELSLFKGLGLCKRTKGITKPQTMKTTLNERLNERKKVVKMSRLMFS